MRRVIPSYWYVSPAGFCKYAADVEEHHLIFLTDPGEAIRFWTKHGFSEALQWAEDGFPGVYFSENIDVWILSPDPGKEIHGDS